MRIISILAATLILAPQSRAQQSNIAVTSIIEGSILDKTTERPIAEVRLSIRSAGSAATPISTTSDAQGHFLIKDLPTGSYQITTNKDGYAPAKPEGRKTPGTGLFFSVFPGQQLRDVIIRLVASGVITGRVIDANGSSVLGAMASASWSSYNEFGEKTFGGGGSSRTNDHGEFRISGLDPGEYYVSIRNPDQSSPSGAIYSLSYPSGGSRAEPVPVRSGEETPLTTMVIPVTDTVMVPVHVNIITDAPIPPGTRRDMQFGPKGVPSPVISVQGGSTAIDLPGLPLGTNVGRVGLDRPEGKAYGETTFEVGESAEKVTVNVIVRKGVRFTARVMLERPDGALEPLPGVRVQIASVPGFTGGLSTQTGADGIGSIGSTPELEYRLTVSGLPGDVAIIRSQQDGKDIPARKVVVAGDTRIEIVARAGGGTVDGIVRDAHGKTVQGSLVALIPADPLLRTQYELYRSTTSDQDGKFTLRNPAPGAYKLFAWIEAPEFIAKYEERGKDIQIGEGQHAVADIQLADREQQ